MKKIVSAFLALVFCLLIVPVAGAEEVSEETKRLDTSRMEWAMAMTAHMAGNALDRADETDTYPVHRYMERFSGLGYMSPDRAVVLEFDKAQATSALKALGIYTFSWEDAAPALAETINQLYSPDYTQAAQLSQAEGSTTLEYSKYFTLILLMYGSDISLTSLTAYGTTNSRSAFIISTKSINESFGEADVAGYVQKLGLEMPLVRVYEKADMDELLRENPWTTGSSSFQHLADALLSSNKRRGTLFLAWMGSESPYITVDMRFGMLVSLLRSMEEPDQVTLIVLARSWLPRLGETVTDPAGKLMQQAYAASRMPIAPPEIEYGEELHEAELKTDGTFLVVFERTVPEQETESRYETWYDTILEAALPAAHIPGAVEAVDYIIRCSVTYEGGVSQGGVHLHYPLTRVTVHDARTGEMVRDLGSVKRTLAGTIMLPKGDTWWDPLYGPVWNKIQPLFAENNG